MKKFPLLISLFFCIYISAQNISENDLKKLAFSINKKIIGKDMGNGVVSLGCTSIGRTLLYKYKVPTNWVDLPEGKARLINDLKVRGVAKSYISYNINVSYYYYKNNKLIKTININPSDLSNYNYELGKHLSIKKHPKSKGVNLKIRPPKDWEIKEGNRPNIVKKFLKDDNTYLIVIKNLPTFFSRKHMKEALKDKATLGEFAKEIIGKEHKSELLSHSYVNVDNYPAIFIKQKTSMERLGFKITQYMSSWSVFYEDKLITLMASSSSEADFNNLLNLYFLITNSLVFPEQYD